MMSSVLFLSVPRKDVITLLLEIPLFLGVFLPTNDSIRQQLGFSALNLSANDSELYCVSSNYSRFHYNNREENCSEVEECCHSTLNSSTQTMYLDSHD